MLGRRSRATTLDDIAEARSRAADTISELAEHAVSLARDAGSAAGPTVKHGAETVSHAFERAAGSASGKISSVIKPKRKSHRVRNILIGAAIIGGIFALIQSPLRSKLQERLFGPPPEDDDLPQITLPDDDHEIDVSHASDVETEPVADVVGTPAATESSAPHRGHGHNHDATPDQETNA